MEKERDKEDFKEISVELQEISLVLEEKCDELKVISRRLGFSTRGSTILDGYVTSYLDGIIGRESTIMMSLKDVIEEVNEMASEEGDEDVD